MTAKARAKPMSARKLKALQRSIAIWELRAKGELPDVSCPLCVVFRTPLCGVCPVKERTGRISCCDTPYWDWAENPSVNNAKRELRFLRSLRPKGAR